MSDTKISEAALVLDRYDTGLLGDGGGGDVNWWWDYIRSELDRAHEFYQDQANNLHPQPAELNEVSGNSGELPPGEVTLKQVIEGYVGLYGSLRQAAELMCIDPGYLSRLAGGSKTNPSDEVLEKLGLERRVVYTRKVRDYQPTKLHPRTKCA